MKKKKTYLIPVTYAMSGFVPVTVDEGTSPEEAMQWAEDHTDEMNLPAHADYLDDSFAVNKEGLIRDEDGNVYNV